jgi:TATA-binding protein-associated factor
MLDKNSFSHNVEQQLAKSKGEERNLVCQSVLKMLMMLRQVLDHPMLLHLGEQKP